MPGMLQKIDEAFRWDMSDFLKELEQGYRQKYPTTHHHPQFPDLRSALAAALDELEIKHFEDQWMEDADYCPLAIDHTVEQLASMLKGRWQLCSYVQMSLF